MPRLKPAFVVVALSTMAAAPVYAQSTAPKPESPKEFCWRDSYTRGVGAVPQSCEPGRERIGLFCYSKCPAGMKRVGFDCHSVCPAGMRDDGLFCRAAEYGRGAGYPVWDEGKCKREHTDTGCEKHGAIWYPKCKPGYSPAGCCICRPSKPNCAALGLGNQVDLSCGKKIEIGAPAIGSCPTGYQRQAGLCYPLCKNGYAGVGPVCWGLAPTGWIECGMGAAKDKKTCGLTTFGQAWSVVSLAIQIITFGGSGQSNAAIDQIKKLYMTAKPAIDAAIMAKNGVLSRSEFEKWAKDGNATTEDKLRIANKIVEAASSVADPNGFVSSVAGVIAAYSYPKCSKYFPGYPNNLSTILPAASLRR